MKKALLVMDMQNVCVGEHHAKLFNYDNESLIKSVNDRINEYSNEDVLYICNIMKNNLINKLAPFSAYEGSDEVKLVNTLMVVNDTVLKKYKGDAFTNPELAKILERKGIEEIELVGVDGGGCVAATALGGIKNGYRVSIYTKAVGTISEKKAMKLNKKLKEKGVIFL